MRITIIDGHPDPDERRLCHALTDAYARGCAEGGHKVRRIDISRMELPVLRSRADFEARGVAPDVAAAQAAIGWAEHLVIVYPLWLGTMPALLKTFFEQTLRRGFAFEEKAARWPRGRLKGRSARIVITMGMPALVYRWYFGAHSLKSLERNILKFCGIGPVRETILGLVEGVSPERRARWLADMEALGKSGR